MKADEAKRRLCALTDKVASDVYFNMAAADCWCGLTEVDDATTRIDEIVIAFIEKAVNLAINTDADKGPHCDECGCYIGPEV